MEDIELSEMEIVVGIASPLGTNRENFIEELEREFKRKGYCVKKISLTKDTFEIDCKNSESFKYYLKMQLCNNIRSQVTKGFFAFLACLYISKYRKLFKKEQIKRVYIIDQIKNVTEYEILSHVYGLNYIQVSLFSNEIERDRELKIKFSKDIYRITELPPINIDPQNKYSEIFTANFKKIINKLTEEIIDNYNLEVLPDVTHNLMRKDFEDFYLTNESNKKSGQQIAKLFHKSHYYFNLDLPKVNIKLELKKFIKQILGEYDEYPSQDEFGMNLAYQVSVRSNFPGDRHVGAAIISIQGEVLSVASIRAPSKSSNTNLSDQLKVTDGYNIYKKKIENWTKQLKEATNNEYKDIIKFLEDTLDFHPCTHAEIAAIIDAAKIGVSVKGSILYSTTFPCHLCAKEIINSGISRVVYLEAYPKSKNQELYPNSLDINPKNRTELIPFDFYYGIGPKRFIYAYSLKNKSNEDYYPPLMRYENPRYYVEKEKDVIEYVKLRLNRSTDYGKLVFLKKLIDG
ncbi:cytidine/deoxycytidylate deaminase [Legionella cherrii]|uniref:Cytidine/deoxycytidylate deaminase n=1 Tax=Legionella cherrii TaxID=28084 RepID=A0A0W0S7J4_9GAMM|nr:deaminase [Legionella cherrii]KTC79083.1 cytidine/deoxycytidylate deaminase [Legionella cherrii]